MTWLISLPTQIPGCLSLPLAQGRGNWVRERVRPTEQDWDTRAPTGLQVGKASERDKGLQEKKKKTNQRFNHLKKKKNPQTTPLPFYTLEKKVKKIKKEKFKKIHKNSKPQFLRAVWTLTSAVSKARWRWQRRKRRKKIMYIFKYLSLKC